MDQKHKLVEVKNVKKHFPIKSHRLKSKKEVIKAVDDISFHVYEGETLGIVGESGSGKSTLGRTIVKLHELTDGKIYFNGEDISYLKRKELLPFRKQIQMVFQDPDKSLNPRMKVSQLLKEPLLAQTKLTKKERAKKIDELLKMVNLPIEAKNQYPHEFSGGQKQRIGIARALAVEPKLLVADEPVSALDVSVQSHILNLLIDLQKELNLTYLFISHDLSVVKYISDRVAVMYLGRIVEIGNKNDIYNHTKHPYTETLIQSIPIPNVDIKRPKIKWSGEQPSSENPPSACVFHTRCPYAFAKCSVERPTLKQVNEEHYVACHLYDE